MKKKILCLLTAVFTLITFVAPVSTFAEGKPSLNGLSREELIRQDEIAAENGTDKLITSFKINEYDAYMNLKQKNEATLKQQGLSSADIQKIKEFDANNIITELKNKSDKELMNLGYTEERIKSIKDYDGSGASIQGIFVDLYCDIYLSRHEYDSSYGTTTFRIRFDWEWEDMPVTGGTDIIGAIASEGMYFDDDLSYHRINYYKQLIGGRYEYQYGDIYDFYPTNEIHAMETTFNLLEGYPSNYALEGRAYCGFTKSGRVSEAAIVVHYGHGYYSVTPSVSVGPGSLGLGFTPSYAVEVMNPNRDYYIHSRNYGNIVTIR